MVLLSDVSSCVGQACAKCSQHICRLRGNITITIQHYWLGKESELISMFMHYQLARCHKHRATASLGPQLCRQSAGHHNNRHKECFILHVQTQQSSTQGQ